MLQKKVDKLFELYSIGTPFIPVVKKAMVMHGVELQDCCTKPLLPASEEQTAKIRAVMEFVENM